MPKKGDGSPTTLEWQETAEDTIKRAYKANTNRVLLAHYIKGVSCDGSIQFIRELKVKDGEVKVVRGETTWSYTELAEKLSELDDVAKRLQSLCVSLRSVTIAVPLPNFDWLANYSRRPIKWFEGGAVEPGDPSNNPG